VDADLKRDILRKTILELLMKGNVRYTDLDKRVCATGYLFATNNTFKSQLHYLVTNGYITRISRGIYEITAKGEKYLALLIF
jgi:predicted transcriptional regulator